MYKKPDDVLGGIYCLKMIVDTGSIYSSPISYYTYKSIISAVSALLHSASSIYSESLSLKIKLYHQKSFGINLNAVVKS
jgi:hypothetical protein